MVRYRRRCRYCGKAFFTREFHEDSLRQPAVLLTTECESPVNPLATREFLDKAPANPYL